MYLARAALQLFNELKPEATTFITIEQLEKLATNLQLAKPEQASELVAAGFKGTMVEGQMPVNRFVQLMVCQPWSALLPGANSQDYVEALIKGEPPSGADSGLDEFPGSLAYTTVCAAAIDSAFHVWASFDLGHTGYLTLTELHTMMEHLSSCSEEPIPDIEQQCQLVAKFYGGKLYFRDFCELLVYPQWRVLIPEPDRGVLTMVFSRCKMNMEGACVENYAPYAGTTTYPASIEFSELGQVLGLSLIHI
eukprot:TRINITY_DN30066_c0_g1_i2.p1 TRINITY_DN30066_c0_g1~~TRINITY_DN30066_c0_g1_i2.p1  ORF type:complete len:250 (-),score=57.18 TRINITY_DN30066_c0_g1_i2:122-871(-)